MTNKPHSTVRILLLFLLLAVSLSACATAPKPLTGIVPGREVETLQSSISVSVKSGEYSTSGRGFLIFRQPGRFHLALLSPFGLTVFEVFIDGDRLTCLVPSRDEAYRGLFSELPPESPLQSMAMMKWVTAKPPQPVGAPRVLVNAGGDRFYLGPQHLVERKVSPAGDQVSYENYRNVNGVAFPEAILIASRFGSSVRIVFEDPEINQPVDESTLTPALEGLKVLPLSSFKGF
ncbi:outer membrane lipoprotein LolB [Geomonas sp. Red32]|uniref:outer membrane lipoprotein LolB n=1 Tax=Geomonas sp. Red32 TaxID=2912856 RepID=UPI00202CEC82|nr:outer membrane lipoprotein LolB [Geomonas sp. Red32]